MSAPLLLLPWKHRQSKDSSPELENLASTSETEKIFVLEYTDDDENRQEFCFTEFFDGVSSNPSFSPKYHGENLIFNDETKQKKDQQTECSCDDEVLMMSHARPSAHALDDSYDIVASPLIDNDDVGYDSDSSDSSQLIFQEEYFEEERVVELITEVAVSKDGKLLRPRRRLASFIVHRIKRSSQLDKDDYMNRRTMTSLQERMNGLSVLPGAMYCLYYVFSGNWLFDNMDKVHPAALENIEDTADFTCRVSSWLLQDLYVMPPLPIVFIALGIVAHAPFSFIYHWHYCTTLPPGKPRFDHWSRKFDQAFIHVTSAFLSYGTSGRWDFFIANVVYNAHCVWRNLVSKTATPLKTQTRILVSILSYTMPFLHRGDTDTFLLVWMVFAAAFWLFASYPIRGWSHTAFHFVVALVVPILMDAAGELASSHGQIQKAAQCAALEGKML